MDDITKMEITAYLLDYLEHDEGLVRHLARVARGHVKRNAEELSWADAVVCAERALNRFVTLTLVRRCL